MRWSSQFYNTQGTWQALWWEHNIWSFALLEGVPRANQKLINVENRVWHKDLVDSKHTCTQSTFLLTKQVLQASCIKQFMLRPGSHKRREAIYCIHFVLTTRFFAVWPQIFLIYHDRFEKKQCCNCFFSKTIVVNLAESMCDRNTIMITVPIIQCCHQFLLSELHRSGTHNKLVVHIGHV